MKQRRSFRKFITSPRTVAFTVVIAGCLSLGAYWQVQINQIETLKANQPTIQATATLAPPPVPGTPVAGR